MSSFTLKIIAIITMLCDHIGRCFFGNFSFLNCLGRVSFPLFAFQLTNGYVHTKNLKKYYIRLFLFAIISQIPFSLFISTFMENVFYLNIFFTLLLGLITITIWDKIKNKVLSIFLCIVIIAIAELIHVDYGAWGVLIILTLYLFREKKWLLFLSYLLIVPLHFLPGMIKTNFYLPNVLLCIYTILPICFIMIYNKKQGKKMKYFFYAFYPVHLLILYFLSSIFWIRLFWLLHLSLLNISYHGTWWLVWRSYECKWSFLFLLLCWISRCHWRKFSSGDLPTLLCRFCITCFKKTGT